MSAPRRDLPALRGLYPAAANDGPVGWLAGSTAGRSVACPARSRRRLQASAAPGPRIAHGHKPPDSQLWWRSTPPAVAGARLLSKGASRRGIAGGWLPCPPVRLENV